MSEETNTASSAIWAVTTLLIVGIVAGALYFGGVFNQNKKVDINIKTPEIKIERPS
jgi:hypothetical protein